MQIKCEILRTSKKLSVNVSLTYAKMVSSKNIQKKGGAKKVSPFSIDK